MWFNDIDIELRLAARSEGIAPERHEAALARYLERKRERERATRRVDLKPLGTATIARGQALARRLARRLRRAAREKPRAALARPLLR